MEEKKEPAKTSLFEKIGFVLVSVIIVLVAMEILLRNSVEHMPLKYHKYLPTDVRILAQSSKDQLVPESYVALLGDSYAAGWGDWYRAMLDAPSFDNPPFHSAHSLREESGLNVLSFAQPGGGSFDGIAFDPIRYHRMLLSRGFSLPDPSIIIVYFYEGNDLNDNITFLERYWKQDDLLDLNEVAYLVRDISRHGRIEERTFIGYFKRLDIMHRSYVIKFLYVLARDTGRAIRRLFKDSGRSATKAGHKEQVPIFVRVGIKTVEVPGPLEVPPAHLTALDMARAINVLEASLRYLGKYFTKSRLLLVYIPSPFTSYEFGSEVLPVELPSGIVQEFSRNDLETSSDRVCELIAEVAARLGADFFDVRPPIRAAARFQVIHGPSDWWHFNQVGYEVLGAAVARHLGAFKEPRAGAELTSVGDARQVPARCAHLSRT